MSSMEELQTTGSMNLATENNLSSCEITRNTKGVYWSVKAKHQDFMQAVKAAIEADVQLVRQYPR